MKDAVPFSLGESRYLRKTSVTGKRKRKFHQNLGSTEAVERRHSLGEEKEEGSNRKNTASPVFSVRYTSTSAVPEYK